MTIFYPIKAPSLSHLNLCDNPFGERSREERAELACVKLSQFLPLFQQEKIALQFLADHGRGKSTHLIALSKLFPLAPFTQLHIGENPEIKSSEIQFIDSIENLPRMRRLRLFGSSKVIVFSSHRDLRWECFFVGLPVHTVRVSIETSALHLALNKRIEFSRLNNGPVPNIPLNSVKVLRDRFGDNVRAMESFLYDYFQTMENIANVKL